MPRPKKGAGISAQQRLEDTFWDMFGQMPYSEITVASLSKGAKVNHNTFYYHYESIDEMACRIFEKNFNLDCSTYNFLAFLAGTLDLKQVFGNYENCKLHFQRMCLVASSHSTPWLRGMLKEVLIGLWLKSLHTGIDELDRDDLVFLDFTVAGFMSVLDRYRQDNDLSVFESLMNSDLGKGLAASFSNLRRKLNA
ncbi:MAG: TetR/AcrR family transcriptional regulator [Coriobacteriales bacterium]|jgi:AcrR family transcriptional regulator|nr:TetR/AcrR family transcriptional regulator [Coriobacteriales bacterium]